MERAKRNEFVLVHIQSLSSSIRVDTDRDRESRMRGSFDVKFSFLENEFQSEYSKRVFGESLDAQPDAFMCSINNVKVNNAVDQRACNVVPGVEKSLEVGEVLVVDVSSIIALSGTVDVQIKFNSPMRRVVFGVIPRWHEHWTSNKVYDRDMIVLQGQEKGENVVTVVVTGPGIIFIQSMPFHRLSQRIASILYRAHDDILESLLELLKSVHLKSVQQMEPDDGPDKET
ncbi:hypothetical protein AgCh_038013 [Apium graveolens]